jgi:hypothetical protein
MNQASFKIKKSKLLLEIKKMTKALGPISKWNRYTELELTITDGLLTLVIPGVRLEVKCETKSTAKATLGLFYFRDIINTWNNLEVECIILDESIKLGVTSVRAQTTFFENDSILRSINLPINYSDLHLLQLENKGFTLEEIGFNKLEYQIHIAKRNLKVNIKNTYDILKVYGVKIKEIEEIVQKKIDAK